MKNYCTAKVSLTLVFLFVAGSLAFAQPATKPSKSETKPESKPAMKQSMRDMHKENGMMMKEEKKEAKEVGDVYPLATCPVSGEELGSMGDPVIYDYEGREIRFCCKGCVSRFEAEPDKYIEKIDAAIIEQQKDDYPLDYCIVTSDEKLPEDEADRMYWVYNNRLFVFCCPGCDKKVEAEPAKYMKKLDKAVIEAQKEDYPLDTCVVSGEELDAMGEPINYVHANQLVQFCCKGCVKQFEADPLKYMKKLEEARAEEVSTE